MHLKGNLFFDRYEWAAKKIAELADQLKPNNVVLFDVGAGDGVLEKYIVNQNILYNAFDQEQVNQTIKTWDIEDTIPYDIGSPQIVAMLEVIEHLKNPWLCMNNISKIIAPGGYLILTTPNPTWSNARIDLLRKGYLSCFFKSDLELNHHVFTPWPHIIERILTDSGFEILEYNTLDGKTRFFDHNMRGIGIPVKLLFRSIKKIIEHFDKTACGMSYGIIAKKIK